MFILNFYVHLLLWSVVTGQQNLPNSFEYGYETNITELTNSNSKLKSIKSQITIVPYVVGASRSLHEYKSARIIYFKVTLENYRKLQTVAEFSTDGKLKQLYSPSQQVASIGEFNILKGIISLFVFNPKFESDLELDASGICRTSYTRVINLQHEPDEIIIDKRKGNCVKVEKPIDKWDYSLIPTVSAKDATTVLVRYRLQKDGLRVKETISDEVNHVEIFSGANISQLHFQSHQRLWLIKAKYDPQYPATYESSDLHVDELVKKLIGPEWKSSHLSLSIPFRRASEACSINAHLYHPSSAEESDLSISEDTLRSAVERARDALHWDQLEEVTSMHQLVQLIQVLRCLPWNDAAVERLNQATRLGPPAISAEYLHRQVNTWQEKLVDILVSCGTPTCVTVVIKRLEALTQVADVEQTDDDSLNQEIRLSRHTLFMKLWPTVAHLRQVTKHMFTRILECCKPVKSEFYRFICVSTLSNLWSQLKSTYTDLRAELIQMLKPFLNVEGNAEENEWDMNLRLLNGLQIAKRLKATELLDTIYPLASQPDDKIFLSTQMSAIQTVVSFCTNQTLMSICPKKPEYLSQFSNILIQSPVDSEKELLVNAELIKAIIIMSAPDDNIVTRILKKLSEQSRWALIYASRLVLAEACQSNWMVSSPICSCLSGSNNTHVNTIRSCNFGYAGGWSGLAASTVPASEFGHTSWIKADLFDLNRSIQTIYDLQIVTGPNGDLHLSNLAVNLRDTNSIDKRLFEFIINAHGLETLSGNSPDGTRSYVDGAWVNVQLNYFDTILPSWTIFTGGMTDLLSLYYNIPSGITSLINVLRPLVDERRYYTFTSGWILQVDMFGLLSFDVSGSLESSVFTQYGRSLMRTTFTAVHEVYTRVLDHDTSSKLKPQPTLVKGIAGRGQLDFITQVRARYLPEAICMSMNRVDGMKIFTWHAVHHKPVQYSNEFNYKQLFDAHDYQLLHSIEIPGVSYDLGRKNNLRCNKMPLRNLW